MDEFARGRLEHWEGRVARLERKVDVLFQHLKLDVPDEALAAIQDLLRQGKKAEAVAFYHREKGVSLTEASAAVERIGKGVTH